MSIPSIGLFGDSFGTDTANNPYTSWVDLLRQQYTVYNYCQSGVSEYKILQQLKSVDLNKFDKILITHTSPTRVYVNYNPLHQNTPYHKNCDLILSDVEAASGEFAQAAKLYFKHIFDINYACDVHNMTCREIDELTKNYNVTHITHFDYNGLYQFTGLVNFYNLFLKHRGHVNHYTAQGNQLVYEGLIKILAL